MVTLIRERMPVVEFDDFVRQPHNAECSFEYIAGEVVEVVSNPYSSKIAARINGFLFIYLRQHDIGHLTGADGGYVVSGERYIPDVGFIRYTRQPDLDYHDGYIPNAPDFAVEVLSPSNDDEKMRVKTTNYLAAGAVVWVVDPQNEVVEVYTAGEPVEIVGREGTVDTREVLPGFTLAVRDIFPHVEE